MVRDTIISDKGVERFFRTGSKAGIQAAHAPRLARQLAALNVARQPSDMNVPGWGLHPLKGKLSNHWSVSVSGNWRLTSHLLTATRNSSITKITTEVPMSEMHNPPIPA